MLIERKARQIAGEGDVDARLRSGIHHLKSVDAAAFTGHRTNLQRARRPQLQQPRGRDEEIPHALALGDAHGEDAILGLEVQFVIAGGQVAGFDKAVATGELRRPVFDISRVFTAAARLQQGNLRQRREGRHPQQLTRRQMQSVTAGHALARQRPRAGKPGGGGNGEGLDARQRSQRQPTVSVRFQCDLDRKLIIPVLERNVERALGFELAVLAALLDPPALRRRHEVQVFHDRTIFDPVEKKHVLHLERHRLPLGERFNLALQRDVERSEARGHFEGMEEFALVGEFEVRHRHGGGDPVEVGAGEGEARFFQQGNRHRLVIEGEARAQRERGLRAGEQGFAFDVEGGVKRIRLAVQADVLQGREAGAVVQNDRLRSRLGGERQEDFAVFVDVEPPAGEGGVGAFHRGVGFVEHRDGRARRAGACEVGEAAFAQERTGTAAVADQLHHPDATLGA